MVFLELVGLLVIWVACVVVRVDIFCEVLCCAMRSDVLVYVATGLRLWVGWCLGCGFGCLVVAVWFTWWF